MADDFQEDDFQPEAPAKAPKAITTADDFQEDDFTAEQTNDQPGPLETARQMIVQTREQQKQQATQQAQQDEQARIAEQQKENDPRNWSSTRFKKEMPKPRTPEEQAFYDATLQDIKEREKGLTEKILTDIFGRPGAASREAIRAAGKGENVGKAYERGATNPEASETFQNELLRKQNEGLDPRTADSISGSLGAVSAMLSQEDRETIGRFIAGVPASTIGLIADTATNPADLLITILGERALKYVGKIPLGARTLGERAAAPIQELLTNKPIPASTGIPGVPATSPEIPTNQRTDGFQMDPGQQPTAAPPKAAAAASPSQAQPSQPAAPNALAEGAESLYQKTFNRLQSLENLTKDAESAGYKIKPGEDPGLRSRVYLGIQGKVQSVLEDQTFRMTPEGKVVPTGEGLRPILNDHARNLPNVQTAAKEQDLVEYLKARRTVEDLQRPKPGYVVKEAKPVIATPEDMNVHPNLLKAAEEAYRVFESISNNDAKDMVYSVGSLKDFIPKKLHKEFANVLDVKLAFKKGAVMGRTHGFLGADANDQPIIILRDNLASQDFGRVLYEEAIHAKQFLKGQRPVEGVPYEQIPQEIRAKKGAKHYAPTATIEDAMSSEAKPNINNIASPEQVAAAEKTLADLQAKYGEKIQVFEHTAQRLYDYQKRVLSSLVDSGNMSKAQYDAILAKNPNYVPFDRVLDEDGFGGVVPRIKERFSGANSPVKKIVGSEREIHDPIESMIKNTYKILDSAERNMVARTVAKLADVLPGKIRLLDHADPKAIRYYENGEPKYFMASENITDAMKGLNETSSSLLVKILSMPAHWLRTGATLTPEFMARNVIRDQFTAAIQTKIGYKPLIDNAGALADIIGRREVYYDWLRSGGAHSTITELSRENLGKMLADLRNKPNILRNLNIITKAQDLSQLLEQATRVGVFKRAQQKGLSAAEAGFASREATVDFARIGSNMKEPNRMMAFLNASLQGMDKSVRTAVNDPAGTAVKGSALITMPSVALYLMNRDEPDYKELPMWQKNLFWMFKVNNQWYRVPKPFGYGQVFGSLPERFLEYADTKDPRAIDSLKKSLVESFSPIAGEPESALLPTAIKPIIENFANRSFFTGRTIVPEHKMKLQPSEQSGRYTSQTAKAVGKATNTSPAKFENLVQGYAGGLGRYALQLGDKIIDEVNKFTGKPVEPKRPTEASDIPLVKGFTVRPPVASSESVAEFYEYRKKAETDHLTAKELYEQGDKEGAEKILKSGDAQFYKLTDKAGDSIAKLTAYADGLVKSGKYSEEALRIKLREIDEKKLEIARRVNKVIRAKKKLAS